MHCRSGNRMFQSFSYARKFYNCRFPSCWFGLHLNLKGLMAYVSATFESRSTVLAIDGHDIFRLCEIGIGEGHQKLCHSSLVYQNHHSEKGGAYSSVQKHLVNVCQNQCQNTIFGLQTDQHMSSITKSHDKKNNEQLSKIDQSPNLVEDLFSAILKALKLCIPCAWNIKSFWSR